MDHLLNDKQVGRSGRLSPSKREAGCEVDPG